MALDDDKNKTVHGFFSKDPEKADKEFFGRVAPTHPAAND